MAASAPDTAKPAEVDCEVAEERAGVARMAAARVVPAAAPKEYLHALDVARIFGSVHVVLGHLHALGALHAAYFFGWGFTWVPWFFMLSGYVLTHARLNARDPDKLDSPATFTAVRIATLFPMYALGLVVALLIRIGTEKSVPGWYEMGAQGLLLQAWIPWVTEQGIVGTAHLWFVSCLPLYWLAFRPLYRLLRRVLPRSAEAAGFLQESLEAMLGGGVRFTPRPFFQEQETRAAMQHVESAIFGAGHLAKSALLPRYLQLRAALHSP